MKLSWSTLCCDKVAHAPKTINELGFTHKEQIKILEESQLAMLDVQENIINEQKWYMP